MKNKISLFSVLYLSLIINPLWATESKDGCKALFNSKSKHITFFQAGDFFTSFKPKHSVETPRGKEERKRIRQYEQARDDFHNFLKNRAKEKINIKAEQITVLQPDRTFIPLPVYPTKHGMLTKRGLLHAKDLDPWEWPTD